MRLVYKLKTRLDLLLHTSCQSKIFGLLMLVVYHGSSSSLLFYCVVFSGVDVDDCSDVKLDVKTTRMA